MSELRKKLEVLFLKIIDDPIYTKYPSGSILNAMVEFIKISPKPVDPLNNMAMMLLLSEQMNKSESKPKTADSVMFMMLHSAMNKLNEKKDSPFPNVKPPSPKPPIIIINDEIADLLLKQDNTEFINKYTIIRDSHDSAIGLQINSRKDYDKKE